MYSHRIFKVQACNKSHQELVIRLLHTAVQTYRE